MHRDVAGFRSARGNSNPAITHDHTGDTVPGRRCDCTVPADLCIIVGVRIDKSRGHDCTVCIDNLRCSAINVAHLCYLAVGDGDAPMPGWTASAIDQCSILD